MSIFKNQSNLTITLETGIDLTSAGQVRVLAKDAFGNKKEFVGAVLATTKITYTLKSGDLDTIGVWTIQASASFGRNNYLKSYGSLVKITVLDNIEQV